MTGSASSSDSLAEVHLHIAILFRVRPDAIMRILCRNAETLSFIDLKEDALEGTRNMDQQVQVFVPSLAALDVFTDPDLSVDLAFP